MRIYRTPDARFAGLPDWPYAPNYAELAGGLRVHYVDEGAADAQPGVRTQYTLEAKKGMYIEVGFTSVIFQPYTGKPDLGFK